MGTKTLETSAYSWSKKGERAYDFEPKSKGSQATVVGAISLAGIIAAMWCECTFDGEGYETFLENCLYPQLKPGNIVIMDNVPFHKKLRVSEIIEHAGARVVFLPPYHPELNPIENMWSKVKCYLKKYISQGLKFENALKSSLEKITTDDCEGWFDHCGYVT